MKKLLPLERKDRHHLLNYALAAVTANLIRFCFTVLYNSLPVFQLALFPQTSLHILLLCLLLHRMIPVSFCSIGLQNSPHYFRCFEMEGGKMNPQNNSALRPQGHFLRSGGGASKMLCNEDIPVCSKVMSNESMRNFDLGSLLGMHLVS